MPIKNDEYSPSTVGPTAFFIPESYLPGVLPLQCLKITKNVSFEIFMPKLYLQKVALAQKFKYL